MHVVRGQDRETHRCGNFTMATSIRCTLPNCSCECFAPGKSQLRTCEQCRHGWVAHALDKLSTSHSFPSLRVEVVHSDIVFDIASLMLYGTQATPIRLRILLDRLFSVLKNEEVDRILEGLGWGQEDYARGYILQDQDGKVLERWTVASKEEEPVILNQFLRFGETKSIAEVMLHELQTTDTQLVQKKNESDIRAFIERISSGHKVNNTFARSGTERLASTPESSRTVQRPLQRGEPQDKEVGKVPQNAKQRESGQSSSSSSSIPAQNIHLANLEQTVLKAGVVHSPARPRNRISFSNSNLQLSKRSAAQLNSVCEVPSTSGSSTPPLLSSSVSMFPPSAKRYSAFAYKGHRKMTLSKRRTWTPYSVLPNSKQVKCNTCNKWFYDKGTWKIHFGAVHLKVKYRCTVEGCNMAFSSLRSRNRHSANPSPRIHRIVYNNRRGHRRRGGLHAEDMQLQPQGGEQDDQRGDTVDIDGDDDDDDVTMVTDDVTMVTDDVPEVTEEENSTSAIDEDARILDSQDTSGDDCQIDNSAISLNNTSASVVSSQDEMAQDVHEDKSEADLMQNVKKEASEYTVEDCDPVESQPVTMDVKPSDISEQSQLNRDSPTCTMHHFKKRKSNAPRKVFIPKQEEDADCQVEDVVFKTENVTAQNEDVLDVEEEETGIDLEEIVEYEAASQDDGDHLSNEHHYIPHQDFRQKGRQLADRTPTSQSESGGSLQLEQENIRHHVAEQLGIGIDTCFYMNAEGLPSCYLCGKTFQSKQTVKVHYQNVHLKLMHACTIEGCNAMFPSRRSRDRHSTNFNLHRKLFEKGVPLKDGFDQLKPPNPTYGPPPGQAADPRQNSSHHLSDSNSINSSEGIRKGPKQAGVDASLSSDSSDTGIPLPSANEIDLRLTRQELHSPPAKHRYTMQDTNAASSSFSASPPQRFVMQVDQNGQSPLAYNQTFGASNTVHMPPSQERYPLKFVGSLICNICKKAYSTKDTLRTHYKNIHLREMHKCTVQGCNLMFSSVRSRNRHSQNPNLHRHCLGQDSTPDVADHDSVLRQ